MNYQEVINEIYQTIKQQENIGQVAAYIPELSKVDPTKFGACLRTIEKEKFEDKLFLLSK